MALEEEEDTLAKRAKIAKEDREISMDGITDENEIGTIVVDTAIEVHQELGPGLLESVYEVVLVNGLEHSTPDPASRTKTFKE